MSNKPYEVKLWGNKNYVVRTVKCATADEAQRVVDQWVLRSSWNKATTTFTGKIGEPDLPDPPETWQLQLTWEDGRVETTHWTDNKAMHEYKDAIGSSTDHYRDSVIKLLNLNPKYEPELDLSTGYSVYPTGEIVNRNLLSNKVSRECHQQGNWFPTRELALQAAKRRALITKYLARIKELNRSWKPNWDDGKPKWRLVMSNNLPVTRCMKTQASRDLPDGWYFPNEQVGNSLCEEFTYEELKLIILGEV